MDKFETVGLERFMDKGVEIHTASDVEAATQFITTDWIEDANEAGLDGEAVLSRFQAKARQ